MDTFLKDIEETLNTGDKEVRTWFLVRHNYLPFILCGCYVLFTTTIGPALMRNRKPFELKTVMVFFNFSIVATYTVLLLVAVWYIPQMTGEEFCKGGKVVKGDITYPLATAGWVFYILRYIEFMDTVFFVLRKKENQLTFLHIIHHTLVPLIAWIVLRTERSGIQSIPAITNAMVHVIMYSYYGLAAMGPEVRKYLWWKKYITQLQMLQFFLMILIVGVVAPLSGCRMFFSSYILMTASQSMFLYLFYKFYESSFRKKSVEKSGNVKNGVYENRNGTVKDSISIKSQMENHTSGKSITNGVMKKQE